MIIALIIVILIAALLGYAATKPATFRMERSTSIDAPPEKIFALINDFHRWTEWSPWENLDPHLKRTYGGAAAGKHALYEWEGSRKVGQGRMEITESRPPSKVIVKLDFLKPFEAHNTAEFTMDPRAGGTHVMWAMYGPNAFMGKVMSVFVDMERIIGKDFETGLANLKSAAERS